MNRNYPDRKSRNITLGDILGATALVAGVGYLGAVAFDLHAHRCTTCGNRWRHLGAFNGNKESAHRCPKCGDVQWWKEGFERPTQPAELPPVIDVQPVPKPDGIP